jgi:hypothetical protein
MTQQEKAGPRIKVAPVVACRRCGRQVYPLEQLEPDPGQVYHDRCFRCDVCKTKLSLGSILQNYTLAEN